MLKGLLGRGGPPMGGAVMAVILAACGGGPVAPVSSTAAPSVTGAALAGRPQPYQLYTHCGIDEARIGGYYFEAVHPLSDEHGNLPPGWGNPYQQGTMTLLSPAEAVFRDRAGHQVRFRLLPSARTFKHVCA